MYEAMDYKFRLALDLVSIPNYICIVFHSEFFYSGDQLVYLANCAG